MYRARRAKNKINVKCDQNNNEFVGMWFAPTTEYPDKYSPNIRSKQKINVCFQGKYYKVLYSVVTNNSGYIRAWHSSC